MHHRVSPPQLRRFGANLAALAVGGVAATATWHHIAAVGAKYGESMAAFLPVSIDGMMITGVIMAADAKSTGRPVSPWARIATWSGAVLSIAAQVESGRARGPIAAAIATVFSLTLLVTVEALFHRGKVAQILTVKRVDSDKTVAQVLAAPLPAPVSPAPYRNSRGPQPRRTAVSPLTGRTLGGAA